MNYYECKFSTKDGKCSHKDAPEPRLSPCIGKTLCGAWDDDISCEVKEEEANYDLSSLN